MTDIVPLFSTAASLKNGGIFTAEKAEAAEKAGRHHGPVSLCDLAIEEGLKQIHVVDDRFANFFALQKNLKDIGCQLCFGLRVAVCDDMADKSEASLKTQSNVVIWMNGDGSNDYETLIGLYTVAAQEGFYYVPRLDWKMLCGAWEDDLILSLPFYSSFLARNTLTFASIVPQLPVEKPWVLREVDQQVATDFLIDEAITRYVETTGAPVHLVKSIYYRSRADAKAFQVWRAILGHATFDKPNDGFTSREFCWEAYQELTAKEVEMKEAA